MPTPRVLFFGYSEVGYAALEWLLARETTIAGVFTHADDPGETNWFRSVAALATSHQLPVFTPDSLKDPAWVEKIRALRPDLILSFYYRNMIPGRLLALAPLGAFNLHGSYLPRYRGRAPLNWAIINGEDHTGVSLHVMVKEADAGDLVDQEKIPLWPDEPVTAVLPRVREAAVAVLSRQLEALLAGRAPRVSQDHTQATYFGKRTAEDGRIDWSRSARPIFNLVRALTHPFPGAFTEITQPGTTRRLLIWSGRVRDDAPAQPPAPGTVLQLSPLVVACGEGAFEVGEAQWASQAESPSPAGLNVGDRFG